MREIKFRAWDNENNQMLDVQNLDFEDCFYGGETQIRTTMYNDYFDIREMPLMQYTGLKDKNGKEIYEGDIVKVFTSKKWRIGKIIYEHSGFTIDVTNNKELEYGRTGIIENLTEVIGNIYENLKLLEE